MATYLAHDALRLPAASLLANSGLCVNIEIKIWLLLGVNVDTAYKIFQDHVKYNLHKYFFSNRVIWCIGMRTTLLGLILTVYDL